MLQSDDELYTVEENYYRNPNGDIVFTDECQMHAANGILVNALNRDPMKQWSDNVIPSTIQFQGERTPATIWQQSSKQKNPDRNNAVAVNWGNLFQAVDTGGKVKKLSGRSFLKWSKRGKANARFRYAVAMLPTTNEGHVVSIVRSKRPGDNRLILLDSNLGYPKLLSDEAKDYPERWELAVDGQPVPYVIIYESQDIDSSQGFIDLTGDQGFIDLARAETGPDVIDLARAETGPDVINLENNDEVGRSSNYTNDNAIATFLSQSNVSVTDGFNFYNTVSNILGGKSYETWSPSTKTILRGPSNFYKRKGKLELSNNCWLDSFLVAIFACDSWVRHVLLGPVSHWGTDANTAKKLGIETYKRMQSTLGEQFQGLYKYMGRVSKTRKNLRSDMTKPKNTQSEKSIRYWFYKLNPNEFKLDTMCSSMEAFATMEAICPAAFKTFVWYHNQIYAVNDLDRCGKEERIVEEFRPSTIEIQPNPGKSISKVYPSQTTIDEIPLGDDRSCRYKQEESETYGLLPSFVISYERTVDNPTVDIQESVEIDIGETTYTYELGAMVVAELNHYISVVRSRRGLWVRYDDMDGGELTTMKQDLSRFSDKVTQLHYHLKNGSQEESIASRVRDRTGRQQAKHHSGDYQDLETQRDLAAQERINLDDLVEIKQAGSMGEGLFAKVDLEPGELQLSYFGKHYANEQQYLEDFPDDDAVNAMEIRGEFFDGTPVDSLARRINHRVPGNMEFVADDTNPYVQLVLKAPVKKGEQLFVDYGKAYPYEDHGFTRT